MSQTLGEKLRQAREERGISINEVAEQTRISPHYLDFIENDDYRTLPGGIFNKGFVKSYAKYVGIDETEALQDYARLISSQSGGEINDDPKTYKPEVLTDDRASSSFLPTIIFAVIILGLMTWGILALVNYIQDNPSALTSSNANQANANANAAAANANTAPANANTTAAIPATDRISAEVKGVTSEVWVSYWTDGKRGSMLVKPDTPLKAEAQQNFKVAYSKDQHQNVQMTLNGKQITLPSAPENPRRNAIEFEINKNNIAQILQSGQISFAAANSNTAASR